MFNLENSTSKSPIKNVRLLLIILSYPKDVNSDHSYFSCERIWKERTNVKCYFYLIYVTESIWIIYINKMIIFTYQQTYITHIIEFCPSNGFLMMRNDVPTNLNAVFRSVSHYILMLLILASEWFVVSLFL